MLDKENNTIHGNPSSGMTGKFPGKKPRSKSLGPGGLEALSEDVGNRQKVVSSCAAQAFNALMTSPSGISCRQVNLEAYDTFVASKANSPAPQLTKVKSREIKNGRFPW
jgi:hypothetical protein